MTLQELLLLATLGWLIINNTCPYTPYANYSFVTVAGLPLPQLEVEFVVEGKPSSIIALLKPYNMSIEPAILEEDSSTVLVFTNVPVGVELYVLLAYENCTITISMDTGRVKPSYITTTLVDTNAKDEVSPKPPRKLASMITITDTIAFRSRSESLPWTNIYFVVLALGFTLLVIVKLIGREKQD